MFISAIEQWTERKNTLWIGWMLTRLRGATEVEDKRGDECGDQREERCRRGDVAISDAEINLGMCEGGIDGHAYDAQELRGEEGQRATHQREGHGFYQRAEWMERHESSVAV